MKPKTTARNHGLLAAGLGMVSANSYKPPAVAIGSGGLLGVQSYNNELADLSKQRMNQIQGANAKKHRSTEPAPGGVTINRPCAGWISNSPPSSDLLAHPRHLLKRQCPLWRCRPPSPG